MSKKSKADRKRRRAARDALECAFVHRMAGDNISQARGLVAFLKSIRFEGTPREETMHGFWLVLMLLDILLEQADRKAE